MNPMIETFGALVGKAAAKSPDRARRLLEAAFYASNFQAKHFPSRKLTTARAFISPVCMDAVLHPLAHPERSAIVNLFLPCEIHMTGNPPCPRAGSHKLRKGSPATSPARAASNILSNTPGRRACRIRSAPTTKS